MRKYNFGIVLVLAGSLLFSDTVTAGVVPDAAVADGVSEGAVLTADDGSEAAVMTADDVFADTVTASADGFGAQGVPADIACAADEADAFDFLYEDRGRFLTEQNRIVYDRLRVFANEVAESKHDTAVLELAPADLGLDTEYTLSDLGVTAFKEGEGLSEETLSALKGKVSVDLQSVTCSLVADDPLAFFWYDSDHKDTEEQWDAASLNCEFTGTVSDDGELLTLDDASVIRIGLMVLPEYSSAKEAGTTAVDRTETAVFKSSLEKAKSKANTIKNSAPSGASDRDRLEYYMTQICGLVEYDKDAAGHAAVQMANVFNSDGTAVASGAGYAAAFRYLCDITSFKSAWISAIVVEGTVKVDGGEDQSHVWNLVQMNDGKGLYLVDAALCDTAAGNGELFLTGTVFDKGENGYKFEPNEKKHKVVYKYDNPVAEPYNPDELKLAESAYDKDAPATAEPGKQVMGVSLASPDTKTSDLNYRLGMDVPKPVTVTVMPADAGNPDFELSNVNESVITVEKAEESSDLNITIVGVGMSKITVTTEDGNFSDTMTVTVRHTTPAAKEQGDYIGGLTPEATYSVGIYNGNMSSFTADENGQIPILPEWRSKTIGIIRTDAVFSRLNSDTQSLKINRKAIAYDPESGVSVAFDDSEDEVFTYTGRKIKPKVIVYNEARTFVEKTDYVVTYKKNLEVGTARVIVKAAKKSKTLSKKFKQTFTFEIVPHDISEGVEAPAVYIESGKKAKPFLLFGKKKLTAGKDFDYDRSRAFTENGSLTVAGINNFTGDLPVDVVIRTQKPRKFKAKIFKDEDYEPLTYDGSEQYPDITVYDPKEGMEDGLPVKVLSEGTDYIIGWPMNCTDAGKHKYTIYGIGEEYSGTITKSYSIRGVKLWESKEDIDWPTYMEKDEETGKYEYEELPYRPGGVTIDDDDSLFGLEKGVDYTITYSNNKKPGIAKYTIKFKKNYGRTKSISRKFRIVKASIAADAEASLILSSQYFDGSDGTYAATPYVVCDDERGSLLKKGKDYIMHYYLDEKHSPDREITKERPVTAGDFGDKAFITIYATAVGKGKYDPETSIAGSYRLYRTPPAEPAIDLARDVKVVCRAVDYKGVRIEPSPELIDSVEICRDGVWTSLTGDELEDFKTAVTVDLACANNLNAGTASLIITGRNNAGSETPFFYGSKKVSFKIKKSVG